MQGAKLVPNQRVFLSKQGSSVQVWHHNLNSNQVLWCFTTTLTPWFPHTSPCPETHLQFLKQFLQAGAQWDPQWHFQDWVERHWVSGRMFSIVFIGVVIWLICSMYRKFTCIIDSWHSCLGKYLHHWFFGLLEIEVMFFSIGGGFTCFVVASTTLSTLWYWAS